MALITIVHRKGFPLCAFIYKRHAFPCHLEYRPKLGLWDVMTPVRYGYTVFFKPAERHPDFFAAISALRRLNAVT